MTSLIRRRLGPPVVGGCRTARGVRADGPIGRHSANGGTFGIGLHLYRRRPIAGTPWQKPLPHWVLSGTGSATRRIQRAAHAIGASATGCYTDSLPTAGSLGASAGDDAGMAGAAGWGR